MAAPQFPEPVKFFVAILWANADTLPQTYARVSASWGAIDFEGPDRTFDLTSYYESEMGPTLYRRLVSFEPLHMPEEIIDAKLQCNAIEDELATTKGRVVNLDIGYLDHNKIVLASCKGAGQKIYLGRGIWADLVARYARGGYQPFEWTFPDFKDDRYDPELALLREVYRRQLKTWRQRANGNK